MATKLKCESCGNKTSKGNPISVKNDYCYGCKRLICVTCSFNYDHLGWNAPHASKV